MFRHFVFWLAIASLVGLPSAFAQSAGQIDSVSIVGKWMNAAIPGEQLQIQSDGQFVLDERGQHVQGRWELQNKILILHLPGGSVATAQWDGSAFIDNEQKPWVRSDSAPAAASAASGTPTGASAPAPAAAATPSSGNAKSDAKAAKTASLPAVAVELTSRFKSTKFTADMSDIVTPGTVLVLHKDGLLMYSIDTKAAPTNTYKDGKLGIGLGNAMATDMTIRQAQPGMTSATVPQRKFVEGEKFWYVATNLKDDGITIKVCSDAYNNVRYYGFLKIPFQKHTVPPVDEVMKTLGEVVTVQPTEEASAPPAAPAPEPPAQAASATAAIPPPAPPADTPPAPPKTITVGQTISQVTSTFGPPQKDVKLGAKEIYVYPDMKVTFTNGKVTDVQ